jgi:uncharacterized protein (TIGR03083 family)
VRVEHSVDLLIRAAEVARRSVERAGSTDLATETPCKDWDLAVLVRHVADSAAVLRQIIDGSTPERPPEPGCGAARTELLRLTGTAREAPRDSPSVNLVALTGCYELVVHAWDLDQSTGTQERLPADLVSTLLELAPCVLADVQRAGLFAAVQLPGGERGDLDRLLALFGRRIGARS